MATRTSASNESTLVALALPRRACRARRPIRWRSESRTARMSLGGSESSIIQGRALFRIRSSRENCGQAISGSAYARTLQTPPHGPLMRQTARETTDLESPESAAGAGRACHPPSAFRAGSARSPVWLPANTAAGPQNLRPDIHARGGSSLFGQTCGCPGFAADALSNPRPKPWAAPALDSRNLPNHQDRRLCPSTGHCLPQSLGKTGVRRSPAP